VEQKNRIRPVVEELLTKQDELVSIRGGELGEG
jgi:hypothetical protein